MKKVILLLLIVMNIITPAFTDSYTITSAPVIHYSHINYDGAWQDLLDVLNNTIDLNQEIPGSWQMTDALIIDVPSHLETVTWDFRKHYTKHSQVGLLIINEDPKYNSFIHGHIDLTTNKVRFDFSKVAPEFNYMFVFEKILFLDINMKI